MDIGLDYAWSRPSVAAIRAYGATWVARYLCKDATKRLQVAERDALLAAGIDIVLVYEDEAGGARLGWQHGYDDALRAVAQAQALGYPTGRTIYYAIDWDATEAQQGVINDYLLGARVAHAGRYEVGAYGGYWPLKRALDAGVIRYAWQTYAWSGGNWDPRAQLRQVRNGITVGGADCDRNERWAPAGSWLGEGGDTGMDARVEGNLVAEIDALVNGVETVKQISVADGTEITKPVVPNTRLRQIAQALGADRDDDGPVDPLAFGTPTDAQVAALVEPIADAVSAAVATALAELPGKVADIIAERLRA